MGIKGFPTLKLVVPDSKPGKPRVEDYQGGRTAKAIVDAVVDKIPNHVKKLQDKDFDGWLSNSNDTAKVILFTDKGTTSALLRALAIDFLGSVSVAQVRQKETAAIASFGIEKFPSLVLLPGGSKDSILYDGEMKKEAIVKFFSQVAAPNPDPAPKKPKAAKSSKSSKTTQSSKTSQAAKASSSSSVFSEASASHKSADASEAAASASTIVLEDFEASESPKPIVPPVDHPLKIVEEDIPPLRSLFTPAELTSACLGPKTGTCVLALIPAKASREDRFPEPVVRALQSLAEIQEKHARRKAKFFPFYAVPAENEAGKTLRDDLGLKSTTDLEIIAINGKRKWWRQFEGQDGSIISVETFIDAIKLGEGKKQALPASVIPEAPTKDADHDEL